MNWGTFGNSASLDFGFSVQDSLFNISMHSKKQWQNINSEEGPKPTFINENSKYIFTYTIVQDAANNEMVARMKEIKDIISTFKFIK